MHEDKNRDEIATVNPHRSKGKRKSPRVRISRTSARKHRGAYAIAADRFSAESESVVEEYPYVEGAWTEFEYDDA
ncbi:hypothetical protein GCM10009037_23390 [Halarchaeum grantii]|uniref:Uncharacterized protein n=1 Tax=Halarchaeum grantii TaxID=1193105 RepID=A0A830FEM0_9EURY|nr:hypothetical protein [Halarchaeum grantii]GGL39030.1 hypothetical protein GCM10009037_23390 [Halarchaeum grantii]